MNTQINHHSFYVQLLMFVWYILSIEKLFIWIYIHEKFLIDSKEIQFNYYTPMIKWDISYAINIKHPNFDLWVIHFDIRSGCKKKARVQAEFPSKIVLSPPDTLRDTWLHDFMGSMSVFEFFPTIKIDWGIKILIQANLWLR